MTPEEILKDPHAAPSVVWKIVEAWLGEAARVYETETLHLGLERRGVPWTPELAAKVLGAQTILVSNVWTYDYDVFFAFSLACDGVPSASDAHHHPTPIQMAWAASEIEELTGKELTHDEGLDPDTVDPAIALVLFEDGWIVTPDTLTFVQDALDRLTPDHQKLRADVQEAWARLRGLDEATVRRTVASLEGPEGVQLTHLLDCGLELKARACLREEHRQHVSASS